MTSTKIIKYFTVLVGVTFLTFFFHEMSHWISYKFLGYDAGFTINQAYLKDSSIQLTKTEKILTSSSGPLFTILQALTSYFILKKNKNIMLYPLLFLPFIMRLGAAWANIFEPNDEGRVSLYLGLNLYVIPIIVVSFLFLLIYKISKKNKISIFFNFLNFIASLLLISILVYLDFKYKIKFV